MANLIPISDEKLKSAKETVEAVTGEFILRNKKIRVNENGFVSLNDIHKAAGFRKNKRPFDWSRLPTTNPLIIATHERVAGLSRKSKIRISDVYQASATGTWAHPILAASYAGYLKPELEVEINEVWLRYKSADPTLADEVLEKSTDEQNEWAAMRALGRVKRNEYTNTLKDHDVTGYGYGNCTNAVYKEILGGTAKAVIKKRDLPTKTSLRDKMSTDELVFVMAAEVLAKQRIAVENSSGNSECQVATQKSAANIAYAIKTDTKDRQAKLF